MTDLMPRRLFNVSFCYLGIDMGQYYGFLLLNTRRFSDFV